MKAALWLLAIPIAIVPFGRGAEGSSGAARAFLGSLPKNLLAKAKLPFEAENRTAWMYVPGTRLGVSWKDLDAKQRGLAEALLRSALSDAGFRKAERVRTLEGVLRDLEGAHRDPDYYVFAIFGEPSEKGNWGWRYEGHHISLSFTFKDDKCVSTTPQFFGANPAEVQSGSYKGFRLMPKEEDLARELLASLSETQRKQAVLSDRAPADIATSNTRKATIQEDKGLAQAEMTAKQAKLFEDLVKVHAEAQNDEQAKSRLAKIAKAGWGRVRFAWMGGTGKGQGFYYRIQGPSFLIELDDTQNNANHIHAVWRDFNGDFGEDELAHHYAAAAHHQHRE